MMQDMAKGGLLDPGGRLAKQKGSTGKRLTNAERVKLRKERERELRRKKRDARKGRGNDNGEK